MILNSGSRFLTASGLAIKLHSPPACTLSSPIPCPPTASPEQYQLWQHRRPYQIYRRVTATSLKPVPHTDQWPAGVSLQMWGGNGAQELLDMFSFTATTAWRLAGSWTAPRSTARQSLQPNPMGTALDHVVWESKGLWKSLVVFKSNKDQSNSLREKGGVLFLHIYKCFTFYQVKMVFALQWHDLKFKTAKLCWYINNKAFC